MAAPSAHRRSMAFARHSWRNLESAPCSLPAERGWKVDGEPPLGAAWSKVARYRKVTINLDEIVQRLHERFGARAIAVGAFPSTRAAR
jgi:hypothetical protein